MNKPSQRNHEVAFVFGVPLMFLFLAGCGGGGTEGPPRAAVEGTVTYNGAPLPKGVIQFVPDAETTGPKTTAPILNGAFKLPAESGPLVGSHKVEIIAQNEQLAPDDEQAIERLRAQGIKKIETIVLLPVYNTRTKLKATITADGENKLTFPLNAKGE